MDLKPGSRWKSAVCKSEVVVVRPPSAAVILECGGHPMLASAEPATEGLALDAAHAGGVMAGKRYVDDDSGLEVLGAKPGQGSLSANGRPLRPKEAKPLPASD